jgi:hypothetical protein
VSYKPLSSCRVLLNDAPTIPDAFRQRCREESTVNNSGRAVWPQAACLSPLLALHAHCNARSFVRNELRPASCSYSGTGSLSLARERRKVLRPSPSLLTSSHQGRYSFNSATSSSFWPLAEVPDPRFHASRHYKGRAIPIHLVWCSNLSLLKHPLVYRTSKVLSAEMTTKRASNYRERKRNLYSSKHEAYRVCVAPFLSKRDTVSITALRAMF